jgi:hypothetical protein
MARQALEAGLLDEIGVELVPVILGSGTPLIADLASPPVEFEGPIQCWVRASRRCASR